MNRQYWFLLTLVLFSCAGFVGSAIGFTFGHVSPRVTALWIFLGFGLVGISAYCGGRAFPNRE